MIFDFFREVTTSLKNSSYPMSNTTVITLNAYCKKLTYLLGKAFKAGDKTILRVPGNENKSYAELL